MILVSFNFGGALLRWPDAASVPYELDIFSKGIHVGRLPLIRIDRERIPLLNMIDEGVFLGSIDQMTLISGQADSAGWGANIGPGWNVEGEDTPFCFREDIGDYRITRYDLTAMAGAQELKPTAGQTYFFSLDLAQHRCGCGVAIDWLDAEGAVIGQGETWREFGPPGGADPADYAPVLVSSACPAGAERLRLVLIHGPVTSERDSYVFFRNPVLTLGDPRHRAVVAQRVLVPEGDAATMGILPLGDLVREHPGPFELRSNKRKLDLPASMLRTPALSSPLTVVANGGYLDISLADPDEAADVSAYVAIDNVLVGHITLRQGAGPGSRMLLPLPVSLINGERHKVEVRGADAGELIHGSWLVLPALQTPPEVLQRATSRIDRPGLLPLSDMRYEALTATLQRLAAAPSIDPSLLAMVNLTHALVLKGPNEEQANFAPLTVPGVDDPTFSIIIPVHNKFYFTYFCICAVIYTCAGLSFEIVLVDDGSSDETIAIKDVVKGLRIVRHKLAKGFVEACNAGAAAARGKFLMFLNNDTEVTGRWLEELHLPFELFDRVGLTGSKLVYPHGKLQEAGGIIWGNGHPWNYGRDGNIADSRYGYTRQTDYISGAAIMIPRDLWQEVGCFSPEFRPAYYEDTDLAFKVRAYDYRTVYAAKSMVVHYEGISNGRSVTGSGLKRYQELNRVTFEEKWQEAFPGRREEGDQPDLEKDRGVTGRALILDYQPPRFDKDAGSFAISQEIRLLQALGYKVSFAPANLAYLDMYTEALERSGVEHLHAPFYTSLADVIERRGAEMDLIYVHRFTTGEGLMPLIRKAAPNARIVVNCADLHFLREIRAARVSGSRPAFERALARREAEMEVLRQADAVLTYSDAEKAVIETFIDLDSKVFITPWVAANPGTPVPLAERDGVAFIGSYDHTPNRDAVDFFLEECWPRIRAKHPQAVFYVAGSGFERLKTDPKDKSVRVVGWVEDASRFLAQRRAMVAPLRAGAGMKGKVIDAFNSGTPSVLSPVAAEGFPVSAGADSGIARTADDWVEQVSALLTDDAAWKRHADRALGIIRDRFSLENGVSSFSQMLDTLDLPQIRPLDDGTPQGFYPRESLRDIDLLRARLTVAEPKGFDLAAAAE